MQRATTVPKKAGSISFHDEVRSTSFELLDVVSDLPLPLLAYLALSVTLVSNLQKLSPQTRLFKSIKLWSFYVDLEESIGTIESTKAVYDKIFELKIANAQIVINYANFLEENEYWEESFKASHHPQEEAASI